MFVTRILNKLNRKFARPTELERAVILVIRKQNCAAPAVFDRTELVSSTCVHIIEFPVLKRT